MVTGWRLLCFALISSGLLSSAGAAVAAPAMSPSPSTKFPPPPTKKSPSPSPKRSSPPPPPKKNPPPPPKKSPPPPKKSPPPPSKKSPFPKPSPKKESLPPPSVGFWWSSSPPPPSPSARPPSPIPPYPPSPPSPPPPSPSTAIPFFYLRPAQPNEYVPSYNDAGSGADMNLYTWNVVNNFDVQNPWLPLGSFACDKKDPSKCYHTVRGISAGAWLAMPADNTWLTDPSLAMMLSPTQSFTRIWSDKGSDASLDGAVWRADQFTLPGINRQFLSAGDTWYAAKNATGFTTSPPAKSTYSVISFCFQACSLGGLKIYDDGGSDADAHVSVYEVGPIGAGYGLHRSQPNHNSYVDMNYQQCLNPSCIQTARPVSIVMETMSLDYNSATLVPASNYRVKSYAPFSFDNTRGNTAAQYTYSEAYTDTTTTTATMTTTVGMSQSLTKSLSATVSVGWASGAFGGPSASVSYTKSISFTQSFSFERSSSYSDTQTSTVTRTAGITVPVAAGTKVKVEWVSEQASNIVFPFTGQVAITGISYLSGEFGNNVPTQAELQGVLAAQGFNGQVTSYDTMTGTLRASVKGNLAATWSMATYVRVQCIAGKCNNNDTYLVG